MAGDRELPPLRVKLIGDSSSYRNMMREADQLARKFEKVLLGVDVKVLAKGLKTATDEMRRLSSIGLNTQVRQTRALARNLESAAKALKYINAGLKGAGGGRLGLGMGVWALAGASLGRSAAQAIMAVAPALTAAVKAAGVVAAGIVSQSGQTVRALMKNMTAAVQTGIKAATPAFANMFKAVANVVGKGIQAAGRVTATAITQAGKVAASAITHAAKVFASITGVLNTAMKTFGSGFNTLTRSMATTLQAAIKSAGNVMTAGVKSVGQIINSMIRTSRRGGGGAGGRGNAYGSFGGLGERADIYMHANAIRTLTQTTQSFVASAANWERMQVMMEGFTGSKQGSANVMEQVRVAALESPYDMQTLMDATKQMMGYGAAADVAVDVTRMLGDVAGGSNEKMSRLALGMAQITSMGKLQGNELRQLTEHGFNPLQVIADETGISYATLNRAKEEGLITDKMVVAALKIATSEGGRFANMSARMSNDVYGLGQRIQELATQLQRRFMTTLIDDTKQSLRAVLDLIQGWERWAADVNNAETVKAIARMARDIMVAAVAFHALAGAIAIARWSMRQFISVFGLFAAMLGQVRAAVAGLFAVLTLGGAAANPLTWIAAGLAAVATALFAFDIGMKRAGGFTKFFQDVQALGKRAYDFMQGFMANLGENIQIVFRYMQENWKGVVQAMGMTFFRSFIAIIRYIHVEIPFLMEPAFKAMGNMMYRAMIDNFDEAFKYLELLFQARGGNGFAAAALAGIKQGAKYQNTVDEIATKVAEDNASLREKGLLDTLSGIIQGEFGALPNIPLNLKQPPPAAPYSEPPLPAAPDKPNIDWQSMFGKSAASGAARPVAAGAAPIYRSAEYAVRVQAARDAMQARRRGDTNMETDVEKRMLQELKKISKNTGAKPAPVQINSANFLGQEVA